MKPIHQALAQAASDVAIARPHMDMTDILACFSACLDVVQPTLFDYSVQIKSLKVEADRHAEELEFLKRSVCNLFHEQPNGTNPN